MATNGNSRHKHPLCLSEECGSYNCSGCKQFGTKRGYKCQSCPDFILHEVCATLPDDYTHPLYKEQPLKFRANTILLHHCDACGKRLRGFMFQSSALKLHPLCMTLPRRLSTGHVPHPLNLFVQGGVEYKCTKCGEANTKWKYECEKIDCKVELDMNCAIVDFYGMPEDGINLLQGPSLTRRVMEKIGCSAVQGTVVGLNAVQNSGGTQ